MLISICIPCHKRTHDLKRTLPHLLEAAAACPPVEIVVVDYNSPDGLGEFIQQTQAEYPQSLITYRKYSGREHYHMAHARNLSVLAASGEYIVIHSADIYPAAGYLALVRNLIRQGIKFMYDERYRGVICLEKSEFIAAGGYDERIEFYGPEDRDLHERLERRGIKGVKLPAGGILVLYTPNREKILNYREKISKAEMSARGHAVLDENRQNKAIIANPDGWGAWE